MVVFVGELPGLAATDAEVARLTSAIKRGGDLDPLLDALRETEARRAELRQRIAGLDAAPRSSKLDVDAVRTKLRSYIADYGKLLRGHVPQMQQILRRLIVGKLTFTPKVNGDYEFSGRGTVRPLLAGVVRKLASPGGNRVSYGVRKLASPTGTSVTYEAGHGAAYELPLSGTVRKAA